MPGAGKTTLAKQLAKNMPAVRFCPDEWMQDMNVSLWNKKVRFGLETRFMDLGVELLKSGVSVIYEYGFWSKQERDQMLHLGREIGATVELYYLDVPEAELRTRLKHRQMEGDNIIRAFKLTKWLRAFEKPEDAEQQLYDNHS